MALQKRLGTAAAPPPANAAPLNWGDLEFYSGGGSFLLPEADYSIETVNLRLFTPQDKQGNTKGDERLVAEVQFKSLTSPDEEHEPSRFSLGTKAKLSYMPTSDGKDLQVIPGGAGNLNDKTNWFIFLKSLYDCGMPRGFFTGNVSVLEGLHVHLSDVPEPEDRKGFGSTTTGDVQQAPQQPRRINIVSAILDSGKSFDEAAPVAKPLAKPNGKLTPKAAAAPPPPPPPATAEDEEEHTLALSLLEKILGDPKNAKGIARIGLKTTAYGLLTEDYDEASSKHIVDTWFGNDAALKGLLAEVGYALQGPQIKPQA